MPSPMPESRDETTDTHTPGAALSAAAWSASCSDGLERWHHLLGKQAAGALHLPALIRASSAHIVQVALRPAASWQCGCQGSPLDAGTNSCTIAVHKVAERLWRP